MEESQRRTFRDTGSTRPEMLLSHTRVSLMERTTKARRKNRTDRRRPVYDGSFGKPRFLGTGDPYDPPKSSTQFFSRPGSALRVGRAGAGTRSTSSLPRGARPLSASGAGGRYSESKGYEPSDDARPTSRASAGTRAGRRPQSAGPRGRRSFCTATKSGYLFSAPVYDTAPADVDGLVRGEKGMLGRRPRPSSAPRGGRFGGTGTSTGGRGTMGASDGLFPPVPRPRSAMGVGGGRRGREGERKPIHERVEQRARAARMKHQRGFGPGSAVGKEFTPASKMLLGGQGGRDWKAAAKRPPSTNEYARRRYGSTASREAAGERLLPLGEGTRRVRARRSAAGQFSGFPRHAEEPYQDGFRIHTAQKPGATGLLSYETKTRAARAGLSIRRRGRRG